MAISININNQSINNYSNDLVARRYENQTPLDYALTYLTDLEDLFKFYSLFQMEEYNNFYDNRDYRIENFLNPLKLNGYVAVTGTENNLIPQIIGDYNNDFNNDFFITH